MVDEPPDLVFRAIRSALAQEHRPLELVVAVPAGWRAGPLQPAVPADDVSLRWVEVPADEASGHGPDHREAALGRAMQAACEASRGSWLAPLSPEGELTPDHVGVLLEVALEHELEFVYGQAEIDFGDGRSVALGSWPPARDTVLTLASELYARPLLEVVPYDVEAWRDGESVGWAQWHRLAMAGVRMAGVEVILHRLGCLAVAA